MKTVVLLFAVLALGSSTALAQGRLGFRGIGVELGVVDAESQDATIGGGVFGSFAIRSTNFLAEPYLDYWSQSQTVVGVGEFRARDTTLGARGKYNFTISNPSLTPFAGAGLGFHFISTKVDFSQFAGYEIPGLEADGSDLKLGLDLGGGLAASVKSVELRGEAWYSVVSGVNQLALRFGVMFPMGTGG
jgi:opacity protein-like surface antigen